MKAMICKLVCGILVTAGVILAATGSFGAEFIPLPQFPNWSQPGDAFAVSADGSTVVGTSDDGSAPWPSDGYCLKRLDKLSSLMALALRVA
jgi:hypothetical protein